jgi:hypothetical protein
MKQPNVIANPSTIESSSVIARGKAPKQSGFSLLEISLVIALGTMMTIGYLYNQSQDNQLSNAKVQAGYYLTVNDAVGKYMLTYFDDLKVIPPNCAQVRLTAGGVPSAIASTTNCKFTTGAASGVKSPTNALQPTVTELKKLTMLDSSFRDGFLWTTLNTVNGPKAAGTCTTDCTTGTNTEPTRFVNRIQLWCNGSLLTGSAAATCATTMQLKSLTFNSQPFAPTDLGSFFKLSRNEMLSTAINVMGSNGFMSLETGLDSEGKGMLYGVGRQTSQANPIVFYDSTDTSSAFNNKGITGIMALQNAADLRCTAN